MASKYKAGPASSKKGSELETLDSNELISSLDRILSEFETEQLDSNSPKKYDSNWSEKNAGNKRKPGPASRTTNDLTDNNNVNSRMTRRQLSMKSNKETINNNDINNNVDFETLNDKIDKLAEIIKQGPVGPMIRLKGISAKFGSSKQRGPERVESNVPKNVFQKYLKREATPPPVIIGSKEIKSLKKNESRYDKNGGLKQNFIRNVKPIPINKKLDKLERITQTAVETGRSTRSSSRRSCAAKVNYNESKYFRDLEEEIKLNEEGNTDSDEDDESDVDEDAEKVEESNESSQESDASDEDYEVPKFKSIKPVTVSPLKESQQSDSEVEMVDKDEDDVQCIDISEDEEDIACVDIVIQGTNIEPNNDYGSSKEMEENENCWNDWVFASIWNNAKNIPEYRHFNFKEKKRVTWRLPEESLREKSKYKMSTEVWPKDSEDADSPIYEKTYISENNLKVNVSHQSKIEQILDLEVLQQWKDSMFTAIWENHLSYTELMDILYSKSNIAEDLDPAENDEACSTSCVLEAASSIENNILVEESQNCRESSLVIMTNWETWLFDTIWTSVMDRLVILEGRGNLENEQSPSLDASDTTSEMMSPGKKLKQVDIRDLFTTSGAKRARLSTSVHFG